MTFLFYILSTVILYTYMISCVLNLHIHTILYIVLIIHKRIVITYIYCLLYEYFSHFLSQIFTILALIRARIHVCDWTIAPSLLFFAPLLHLSNLFPRDRKIEIVTAAYRERIDLSSFFCDLGWPLNPFLQRRIDAFENFGTQKSLSYIENIKWRRFAQVSSKVFDRRKNKVDIL